MSGAAPARMAGSRVIDRAPHDGDPMATDPKRTIFPGALEARTGVPRILVIDDEPKLRESLAEGLRMEDWDVATAGSGSEALRLIDASHFELLLVDWMLPDCDGLEVVRRVRAFGPDVKMLMISARSAHADQAQAFAHGVTDYLTKPFAFDELLARCRALLEPARPADESLVRRGASWG
jgi:two-component system OmpR family response regulator